MRKGLREKGEFCFLLLPFVSSPLNSHLGRFSCTHPESFHVFVFYLAPWSLHRPFCPMASCHSASLLALSTPALPVPLPLLSPADDGQLQFPATRILVPCSLWCSLFFTAWQLATVDNTGSFLCAFKVFLQLPRLFGIQSSRYMWKED